MKKNLKTIFALFAIICVFALTACSGGGGGGGGGASSATSDSGTSTDGDTRTNDDSGTSSGTGGTSSGGTNSGASGGGTVAKVPEGFVEVAVNGTTLWVSKYETTQGEYEAVMGNLPSGQAPTNGDASKNPVNMVTWYDAIDYCIKRSNNEKLTPYYTRSGDTVTSNPSANGYRLPTEAEWEYLAKGGENFTYAGSDTAGDVAWTSENSAKKTHVVGTKNANKFGLYDMSGNVWEWTDTASGSKRVRCGGGWDRNASFATVASRSNSLPSSCYSRIGFRVVRSAN